MLQDTQVDVDKDAQSIQQSLHIMNVIYIYVWE